MTATAGAAYRRRLVWILVPTTAVALAELVGGLLSGSFALVADAGHMFLDAVAIAMALIAMQMATRPATARRTFGWQRAEVLAALANGLLLAIVSVGVVYGGIRRVITPQEHIDTDVMIVVAAIGLAVNVAGLFLLRHGQKESLNVRGAYLEILGDALGSVAVVVAGVVVATTGFVRADGIVSIAIGLFILPRAATLLREVVEVLLEATPVSMDLAEVREHALALPSVTGIHDLHAWTITSGVQVLSAHVVVDQEAIDRDGGQSVLAALQRCLSGDFDVDHCTFQIEGPAVANAEGPTHD